MKSKKPKPMEILFCGDSVRVTFLDKKLPSMPVWVRMYPQVLLGDVLSLAEHRGLVIEHCTYLANPKAKPVDGEPAGYERVPAGWSHNLSDVSTEELYEKAKALNFTRAASWGKAQIDAKKFIAPLHLAAMESVIPMIEPLIAKMIERVSAFSGSMPSAPPSPAPATSP